MPNACLSSYKLQSPASCGGAKKENKTKKNEKKNARRREAKHNCSSVKWKSALAQLTLSRRLRLRLRLHFRLCLHLSLVSSRVSRCIN